MNTNIDDRNPRRNAHRGETIGRWLPSGLSGGGGTEAGAISPHDPRIILLNSDMGGVFLSRDGGATWRLIPFQQMQACPNCAPVFHPTEPQIIYAAYGYAAELRVTRDGGTTWAPLGTNAPDRLRALAIDPLNPRRILAGHEGGACLSVNDGADWLALPGITGPVRHVYFSRAGKGSQRAMFAATPKAVYRGRGAGRRWRQVAGPWGEMTVVGFGASSGADDGQIVLYLWVAESSPTAQGMGEILVSRDEGATWQRTSNMPSHPDIPTGANAPWGYVLANDACRNTVYVVKKLYSPADTVWRSDDQGGTWRPVAFGDRRDPRFNMATDYVNLLFKSRAWDITHAALDPSDADHLMYADYCAGFITRDGGRSWQSQSTHPAPDQPKLDTRSRWVNNGLTITTTWNYYVDPFRPSRHFIAYTDLGLAISDDAGASWVWRRDTCVNTYEIAFDPAVPNRLWAAFGMTHDIPNNNIILGDHSAEGHGAVGYSEDGGETWLDLVTREPVNEANFYQLPYGSGWEQRGGLPPATVISIILDPRSPAAARVLYASLWQRGVFRSTDNGHTWEPRSVGLGSPGLTPRCLRVHLHPDGTLFCLLTTRLQGRKLIREGVGLFRSGDEGRHWEKITQGLDVRWTTDFAVDPRDSRVVYLSASDHLTQATAGWRTGTYAPAGGLYKTVDGGRAWDRIVRKCPRHFAATLHPQNPDWIYMTVHATIPEDRSPPPEASLWLSRDAGRSWIPFMDYPFGNACRVHFHPVDRQVMFVTSYGGSVHRGPVEP